MNYNNKHYWNDLVGHQMKLKEVGWPQWTEAFNAARYKLAAEQTDIVLKNHIKQSPKKILEIGCGIGFWTKFLQHQYPEAAYLGIDISEASIRKLKQLYDHNSQCQFELMDITTPNILKQFGEFDLIICMEVLLHITDDKAWQIALENILQACKKNRHILISDPFLYWPSNKTTQQHNYKIRTFQAYENTIEKNYATIQHIYARTFLLDNNIDFRTQFALKFWKLFFKFWHRLLSFPNENIGKLLGQLAYNFDKFYTNTKTKGHGSRLMVIKKM